MAKKTKQKVEKENESGSRKAILEQLFYDFYSSRSKIYKLNFFRGVFFGVGTVVGGTIVVALVVWVLDLFTGIPGGIGDFVQYVVDAVEQSPSE